MKKLVIFTIVAIGLLAVSCGKSLDPETAQTWDQFKQQSEQIQSVTAVQNNFTDFDSYELALKDFQATTDKLLKMPVPKEIGDSIKKITEYVEPVAEQAEVLNEEGCLFRNASGEGQSSESSDTELDEDIYGEASE